MGLVMSEDEKESKKPKPPKPDELIGATLLNSIPEKNKSKSEK